MKKSRKDNRPRKLAESYREIAAKLPLCQAKITDMNTLSFRANTGRPAKGDKCVNVARYKLLGKCYCGRHAGTVALAILLERG